MADLSDIARQVLNATRIVSDAGQVVPGRPVAVSVIPGISNTIPNAFTLAGTLAGTLSPIINGVQVTIEFLITDKNGGIIAGSDFSTVPPLVRPLPPGQSDPLDLHVLLKPPIGEDIAYVPPFEYVINVHVTVSIDGITVSTKEPPLQPLKVPVVIPPIRIPSVLLLAQHSFGGTNYPGEVLCMVRPASPLRTLDLVVTTLNQIADILSLVKDVIGLAGVANPFTGINFILAALQDASVVYFAVGGAPDFNEFGGWDYIGFGGFDDEASSALMLGVTGTRARVWSSEDFSDSDWHEHSTFIVPDIGTENGLPAIGFGVYRNTSFGDWDTDSGDSMHDEIESARFLSANEN